MSGKPPTSPESVKCLIPTIPLPLEWPLADLDEDTDVKTHRDITRPYRRTAADSTERAERRVFRHALAASDHSTTASSVKTQPRLTRKAAMITRSQTTKLARQTADRESEAVPMTQRKLLTRL